MRVPIAYCLAYPQRIATATQKLNFAEIKSLSFEQPDDARFPAMALAKLALAAGGMAPCTLNAANEVAVAAFLAGKISFGRITEIIDQSLQRVENTAMNSITDLMAANHRARRMAEELI
jgi:1-deoxy-D-xylulose-5-phosphate reductoisomerase